MPAFEDVAPRPDPRMLPPQSLEAEQAVLGTILLQPDAILQVVEILKAEDFYREAHRIIFAAMLGLFERREPRG